LDRGGLGYDHSAEMSAGRCYWRPDRADMGIHVVMSASALAAWAAQRQARGLAPWSSPVDLLSRALNVGAKVTRIDLAWDDREGVLSIDEILEARNAGLCVSRFRGSKLIDQCRLVDGQVTGKGVYFGSRTSDSFLRIYDKALEQGEDGHWVRVELELKSDRAMAAALILSRWWDLSVQAQLAGVLYGLMDFKVAGADDANRSRWETEPWWLAFLKVVEKCQLEVVAKDRTIEDAVRYLVEQVAPTLSVVVEILGVDILDVLCKNGKLRWRAKHRRLIRNSEGILT
jgi:phage replication initiation protein